MGEDDKLFGWRKAVQDLNAPARGRPTGAIQVIRRFDDNPAGDDRCAQCGRLAARIARRLRGLWQRLAISRRNVLSRDSRSGQAARLCWGEPGLVRRRNGYMTGEIGLAVQAA